MGFFNNFPYTNFHEMNMDWLVKTVITLSNEWIVTKGEWKNTREEFEQLRQYVNSYFENLDVQEEVNNKLEEMYTSGELARLILNSVSYKTPKMYGAKGDGVADDYEAIQKCFDDVMESGGGKVVFPSGIYNVSKELVIRPHTAAVPQENVPQSIHFLKMDILEIVGEGFVEIKATQTMEHIIKTDDHSYPENVGSYSNFYTRISNIQFNGNNLSNGVYIYQALHACFERNRIYNVKTGLEIYGYGELYIINNVIKAAENCIKSTSGGDSFIAKNDFYMGLANGKAVSTTAFGGSTIFIKNTMIPYGLDINSTVNNTIGFSIYNGEWNGKPALCGPFFICNNSFDDIHICVSLYSGNPENNVADVELYHNKISAGFEITDQTFLHANGVTNVTVHDNVAGVKDTYSRPLHSMIEAVNCENMQIHDNFLCSSNYGGIILYNCRNCEVKSNTLQKYALKDATSSAILFSGNSNNNIATDNVITQNADVSYYPNRSTNGIGEIGTADWNEAYNNKFSGEISVEYSVIGTNSTMISERFGYAAPTTGTWTKGSKVWNKEPYADDKTAFWICVTAGTPGTWGKVKWIE